MLLSDGRREADTDRTILEPLATDLPARLRLLCVGAVEPSWVSLTLQLDAQGCVEPTFKWVSTSGEAITLLREEGYDCLIVRHVPGDDVRSAGDPLGLVRGLRAGGADDPVVILLPHADDNLWAAAYRVQAELLVTANGWGSLALVPVVKRAIEQVQRARDNHRLATAERRRLVRERDEAEHLLNQQRQIVHELEQLARLGDPETDTAARPTVTPAPPLTKLPQELDSYYQELLRTYVIMGSGNLGSEISRLAELLAVAGLTPRQALELHLLRVEQLVRGLGNRSTRHVMARADLLALELMIHLGECYQQRAAALATSNSPSAGPSSRSFSESR